MSDTDDLVEVASLDGYSWRFTADDFAALEDNLVVVRPMDGDFWIKGRLSDILKVVIPPGTALVDISQIVGSLFEGGETPIFDELIQE